MKKTKSDLVRGWLEKARRDLIIAVSAQSSSEPFTDMICFHAQQSAEKCLKAYLIWNDIRFPKTHSIEDLVLLASEYHTDWMRLKDDAAALTPYAVETRYPEFDEPSQEDAVEAIEVAERIQALVLNHLPKEAK